jgi:CheY-like chemotaxis protein
LAGVSMTGEGKAFDGASVLVVDDDAGMRALLALQLSMIGSRVQAVEDGNAALCVLEGAEPIDLLCTDIIMPGSLTGYGVADAAVAKRPGIRVMFMTGYTPNGRAHGQQRHPTAPMLNKPFQRRELVEAVLAAFAGEYPEADGHSRLEQPRDQDGGRYVTLLATSRQIVT